MWWLLSNETAKEHSSVQCNTVFPLAKDCLKPVFGMSTLSASTGQEISVIHSYRIANRKHTGYPQLFVSGQVHSWSLMFYNNRVEWSPAEFALCCRTVLQHLSSYWKNPPSSTHYVCEWYSKPLKEVWPYCTAVLRTVKGQLRSIHLSSGNQG